jgi:tetratricopeptide (TPR) repeat protein
MPGLWRLGSTIAEQRGDTEKSIVCLERALDLEFSDLPEVIDLQSWRTDYGKLLNHYRSVVANARTTHRAVPLDIASRTIRAVDRWRKHDPEAGNACQIACEIFNMMGALDPAWEYLTTAEGREPTNSSTWVNVADRLHRQGDFALADRAFVTAFEADSTNPLILWDRAQNLRQMGDVQKSHEVLQQIADGNWKPYYNPVRANARWQLEQK